MVSLRGVVLRVGLCQLPLMVALLSACVAKTVAVSCGGLMSFCKEVEL